MKSGEGDYKCFQKASNFLELQVLWADKKYFLISSTSNLHLTVFLVHFLMIQGRVGYSYVTIVSYVSILVKNQAEQL